MIDIVNGITMNISHGAIRDMYKDILNKGYLRIPIGGMSMYPYMKDKDFVIITQTTLDNVKIGDIIGYYANELFIVHQVVMIKKYRYTKILTTGGISALSFDRPIQEENIIGKVISIEKPNETVINLETRTWCIINYIIAMYTLSVGLIYQKLCSQKRILIGKRNKCFINFALKIVCFFTSLPPILFINFLCFMQTLRTKLKI